MVDIEKRKDPVKREIYSRLHGVQQYDGAWPSRVWTIHAINSFYEEFKKRFKASEDIGYNQCIDSWHRALGGRLLNKRHHIDALVLTTKTLNENELSMLTLKKMMLDDFTEAQTGEVLGLPKAIDFKKYIEMISRITTP